MKNLIKFELRKILTKRFAVISVAAVLLLSLILSFSTLHSMYAFDGNGAEETGKAAVEIDKQIALKYEGKLTDNKVQQMMSEFKPTQDLHGMNAKYIYQNALQSSVFSHFADIDGNWNGLSVADVFGDKEIKVGYVNGWLSTSQNMAKIFIVLSLVIILLIAPVFSGEYGGVDNIILTSKYGKTKCATAKVLASLLSAVFITTLVVIFNLLIAVAIYGTEGLDCSILFAPIDFLEGYIPFNITCGTVLKYQILLAFMSAISVTGIVLILSAVCKSQMIAFVISAAIHVIPIMLPISETSALSLRKTDIEPLVIEAVKELVSDKYFAKEIEKRIGVQTDTTAIDKELANYESKLKEVDLNKARLEREIDNLPVDTRFRERKIHDMTLRLDALYDTIVELEERIEDAKLRKSSIEMETITLDNIYKLMLNFGKLYDIISDEEKKSLITYLIKEIQIYPNGESEQPLKSIEFNFPIYRDGQEVRRLLWEKGNTVETVVLLSQQKPDDTIEIDLDLDELDATSAELKATYQEIKDYVLKEFGLKVSSLYISQVKRKCGIEVGENYNLPKSENARVPQCPKEKEEAIKAALKYFAMI